MKLNCHPCKIKFLSSQSHCLPVCVSVCLSCVPVHNKPFVSAAVSHCLNSPPPSFCSLLADGFHVTINHLCLCLSLSLCPSLLISACLTVRLPFCLSACLPVYLPFCLPDCLSVRLPFCLSVCLPVRLPSCLPVCVIVGLPLPLSAPLSVCRLLVSHSSLSDISSRSSLSFETGQ